MFRLRLSFIVVLLLGNKNTFGKEPRIQNHVGFGYELTQSKPENMESRFLQSFSDRIDKLQKQVERQNTQLATQVEAAVESKVSQITDQILKLQYRLIDQLIDCSELPKETSGLCLMDIGGNKTVVYQTHRLNVDWLTVLQRYDGSEDFQRNWTDYREGFGTAGKEFWLGLERLHVLTKNDSYELAFELEDFDGNYKYARYDNFSIGSKEDLYRLNVLGGYSGTAGDSFTYHKGYQFSALEKGSKTTCVKDWTGGWWYNSCFRSHLTGKWQRTNEAKSIVWMAFGKPEYTALKFARMLIRKL